MAWSPSSARFKSSPLHERRTKPLPSGLWLLSCRTRCPKSETRISFISLLRTRTCSMNGAHKEVLSTRRFCPPYSSVSRVLLSLDDDTGRTITAVTHTGRSFIHGISWHRRLGGFLHFDWRYFLSWEKVYISRLLAGKERKKEREKVSTTYKKIHKSNSLTIHPSLLCTPIRP